jgi:hypothetical protein
MTHELLTDREKGVSAGHKRPIGAPVDIQPNQYPKARGSQVLIRGKYATISTATALAM